MLPYTLEHANNLLANDRASWRKPFQKDWQRLEMKAVSDESLRKYHTNPVHWLCACPIHLQSRFPL
ncbi:hypothetical protein K470DRAFT_258014 [Piedraia hortae CBS 480.64]|uniref:Uncharacterized protein n=1 Tax=Piedraia hortae CBS 480.64 TaxID=1314780 RepID=A0A6A7BY08_9PEZI|nr:hypothetical protein K470DRAFT_258014 [Piedraia hortae CBS 480.64]